MKHNMKLAKRIMALALVLSMMLTTLGGYVPGWFTAFADDNVEVSAPPDSAEATPVPDPTSEPTEPPAAVPVEEKAEEPAPAPEASGEPAASAEPAASGEPAAEGSEEAGAAAPAPANPNYDPAGHNWASIEIILALVIVVVGAILMLSFGKKKNG